MKQAGVAAYPWGSMSPRLRLTKLETLMAELAARRLRFDEDTKIRRATLEEDLRSKRILIDAEETTLRADIKVATAAADRDSRAATVAKAAKMVEELLARGFDIDAAIDSGEFAEALARVGGLPGAPTQPAVLRSRKTARVAAGSGGDVARQTPELKTAGGDGADGVGALETVDGDA